METVKRTYEHSIAFAWLVLNVHVKIILNGRPLEILGVGGGGGGAMQKYLACLVKYSDVNIFIPRPYKQLL